MANNTAKTVLGERRRRALINELTFHKYDKELLKTMKLAELEMLNITIRCKFAKVKDRQEKARYGGNQ